MSVVIKSKFDSEIRDILDEFRFEDLKSGDFRAENITGGIYFEFNEKQVFESPSKEPVYLGGWIFWNLESLLQSILKINTKEIENKVYILSGSIEIIIEVVDKNSIRVKFFDGSIFLKEFVVNKKEHSEAVISASESLLEELLLKFPNLKNHETILRFEKLLNEVKEKTKSWI